MTYVRQQVECEKEPMTIHHTRLYGFAARLPRPVTSVRVPSRPGHTAGRRRARGYGQAGSHEHPAENPTNGADDLTVLPVSATVPFATAKRPVGTHSELSMRLLSLAMEDATGLPFNLVEASTWMESQGCPVQGATLVVDRGSARAVNHALSRRVRVLLTDGEAAPFEIAVELDLSAGVVAHYAAHLQRSEQNTHRPLELEVSPELVGQAQPFYRFTFDLGGRTRQVSMRHSAHRAITDAEPQGDAGDRTDVGPGAGRLQIIEGGPALQPLCERGHLRVWQRDALSEERLVALGAPDSQVVWTGELTG